MFSPDLLENQFPCYWTSLLYEWSLTTECLLNVCFLEIVGGGGISGVILLYIRTEGTSLSTTVKCVPLLYCWAKTFFWMGVSSPKYSSAGEIIFIINAFLGCSFSVWWIDRSHLGAIQKPLWDCEDPHGCLLAIHFYKSVFVLKGMCLFYILIFCSLVR